MRVCVAVLAIFKMPLMLFAVVRASASIFDHRVFMNYTSGTVNLEACCLKTEMQAGLR